MHTHMNTHASLACKHLMYACTCTHECENTHSLYVCISLCLCLSVICLWIFAHTCIHAHTNARNGCTYCMHPCKCTKIHTTFLSRSLYFIHLGSLSSLPCFSACRHISSHTRATYLYVCVWVCICVLKCLCLCLFCFRGRVLMLEWIQSAHGLNVHSSADIITYTLYLFFLLCLFEPTCTHAQIHKVAHSHLIENLEERKREWNRETKKEGMLEDKMHEHACISRVHGMHASVYE